ncbi:MAG: hypothetical protein HC822_27385 [Oscillochloris sp.]|nr:hypothetical protein [Oscillochloris sp.]
MAAILSGPAVACRKPVLIHGAFGPQAVRCTTGEHIHLEALVNPGIIVGGDGLYDFACATRPCLTEPWREGFSEGYLTAGTLTPEEEVRLPALRLLSCYWNACYNYMRAVDHEPDQAEARRLLHELAPSFKASYAPPHQ